MTRAWPRRKSSPTGTASAFTVKSRAARSPSSVAARQSVTSRHPPRARTLAAPRSGSSGTKAPPRRVATRRAMSSAPDCTVTSRSATRGARRSRSQASRTAPAPGPRPTARRAGAPAPAASSGRAGSRSRVAPRDEATLQPLEGWKEEPSSADVRRACNLAELDAARPDPVLDDLVAHHAAAVLDDAQHARQPVPDALAAEDQDGVRGGADVAGGDLARQQVFESRLFRRHQEQRRDGGVVLAVRIDERAVLPHRQADLHAERLGVPVDDLAIELVEHEALDRVSRRVHRLDAIDHDPPRARPAVEVEGRPDPGERVD